MADYSTTPYVLPSLADLVRVMATSRDPEELRYAWRAWRDAAGRPLRQQFAQYVRLSNEAARINGEPGRLV